MLVPSGLPFAERVRAARAVGEQSSGYGRRQAGLAAVDVYSWNPRRPRGRWLVADAEVAFGIAPRAENFGDLLGPVVVTELLARLGLDVHAASPRRRLFSVGSLFHAGASGDCFWGTGVLSAARPVPSPARLDIRAVRGPWSRDHLVSVGATVPEVYGDPGCLMGLLWSRAEIRGTEPLRDVTVVPHLDETTWIGRRDDRVISPRRPLPQVLARIAASDFVVASSLHAVITAESLGVGARAVVPEGRSTEKYEDYYLGTGRPGVRLARSVAEAEALGPEGPPVWSPLPLLDAFPVDLWDSGR
jgi:pyruvyltransferase